jgi:transposase InsO family protein
MRDLGLEGARRGKKIRTTIRDDGQERAGDLLRRDFTASRPNERWVADFTYVSTWSGIVYVAFVVDVFSRAIVGWSAAANKRDSSSSTSSTWPCGAATALELPWDRGWFIMRRRAVKPGSTSGCNTGLFDR